MTWTWCEHCHHLGWLTRFEGEKGEIITCPECAGAKGWESRERIRLGICKFCSQEIYFPASDIPCTLDRTSHVIAGLLK